jgi:anti-sigma B factor antagonist
MRYARGPTDSIDGSDHASAPAFACSWRQGGLDAGSVDVSGELDIATTPQLERMLRERQIQTPLVVLDLRGLAFMDCSGVRAIVDASIRARKVGRRLVVLRGRGVIDRMLALTGSFQDVEISDADPLRRLVEARPVS